MAKTKHEYTIHKPDARDTLEGAAVEERIMEYAHMRNKYKLTTNWGLLEIDPSHINDDILPGEDLQGTRVLFSFIDGDEKRTATAEFEGNTWRELWELSDQLVDAVSTGEHLIRSFQMIDQKLHVDAVLMDN